MNSGKIVFSHGEYYICIYIDPPKRACICPQYTIMTQVSPKNKLGRAELSKVVPATQSIHVSSNQMAIPPMDAIGCRYQSGCRKKAVYSPAVTAVQQAPA